VEVITFDSLQQVLIKSRRVTVC